MNNNQSKKEHGAEAMPARTRRRSAIEEANEYRAKLAALFDDIGSESAQTLSIDPWAEQMRAVLGRVAGLMPDEAQEINELIAELEERNSAYFIDVMSKIIDWGYYECELREISASERAEMASQAKLRSDPKAAVMQQIKSAWLERKRRGTRFTATAFAHEMAKHHAGAVTVEAIKNAQTRWNKEYHPAG